MGITEILGQFKGKVLDAAHFDLLKHAYELQEQNIAQLKINNESLRESNELLLEKIRSLEELNIKLKDTINNLEARLKKLDSPSEFDLSDAAKKVLGLFLLNNTTAITRVRIEDQLNLSKIEIASAIDELKNKQIIIIHTSHGNISLRESGKKILANSMSATRELNSNQ
jgi:hypothetical protein